MPTGNEHEPQGDEITTTNDQPQGDEQDSTTEPTTPQGDEKLAKAVAESRKWEARAKADAKALADMKKAMANVLTPEQAADKDAALAEALAKANAAEVSATKYRIALAEGLPQDLAERLVGSTEEELREDATRLKAWVKTAPAAADAKKGQAATPTPTTPSPNELLRLIARG